MTANAQTFLDQLRQKEQGKGTVTVVESKQIDSLVLGTIQQKRLQKQKEQTATSASTAATKKEQTNNGNAAAQKQDAGSAASNEGSHPTKTELEAGNNRHETVTPSSSTSSETTEDVVVDTRKKVMRNSYKMQGYRIQVFSGGNSRADRQKAETAGAVMKSNFPSEPIYVHFYSPSWKCRMGNYKTVEEARALLARVKKLGYPQANIVKGTISVQY